jgi:alpha-D-ribose 1-methylphosphonate 5-triphosphate diphosphatase PhnM
MHFDQRTQQAMREFGLSTADIEKISEAVVEATAEDADALEAFFADLDTVYSDMEMAHSASQFPEHGLEYVDLYTHADDLRGYIKFDGWGAYVEGGRVLSDEVVELTLGPTVDERVRFAADRDEL